MLQLNLPGVFHSKSPSGVSGRILSQPEVHADKERYPTALHGPRPYL